MARPLDIQAVVFDLDDTLYPERDYVRSGYRVVTRHLAGMLKRDEPMDTWLWNRFLSGHSGGAFDALNDQFKLGLSAEDISELITLYRQHLPQIAPYGPVPDLLRQLKRRVRLGLLTDGYLPAQQLKLQVLRLRSHFHTVVFTEELGRDKWKPAPDGFELIADQLGAPHEVCCYVGDNPAKDFVAPNQLGWRTIQLRWPDQVHADNPAAPGGQAQHIARNLAELRAALD